MTIPRRFMSGATDGEGYVHFVLTDRNSKGHLWKAHMLVAMAFLGYDKSQYDRHDIYKSKVVNHKDMNKKNNQLENLEVVTQAENMRHFYESVGFNCRKV